VPNGSFEDRNECVYNDGGLTDAPPWSDCQDGSNFIEASPDVFHECTDSNEEPCPYPQNAFLDPWLYSIPTNFMGCEAPYEGLGYAGAFFFADNPDTLAGYREYLSIQLAEALHEDTIYEVSFKVSLAERSTHAIWNIQAALTNNEISQPEFAAPITNLESPLDGTNGNFVIDKDGWTELIWQYQAQGGEEYLTIGNFQMNENTDTIQLIDHSTEDHYLYDAYYYVDAVYVGNDQTSSFYRSGERRIAIWPSPVRDFLFLEVPSAVILRLYNNLGQLTSKHSLSSGKNTISLEAYAPGMYFAHIKWSSGTVQTNKIIKR
jgi:hypothetical protein